MKRLRMNLVAVFCSAVILFMVSGPAFAVGVLTPNAADPTFTMTEKAVESAEKVMVNGDIVFTISGGPIAILDLLSICITANGVTASTAQWQTAPTVGTATVFSGATATLASATAGTSFRLAPTALSTAPPIVTAANGGALQLGTNVANLIIVGAGTIKLVIGTGSTTGTWKHYLTYRPLSPQASVQ